MEHPLLPLSIIKSRNFIALAVTGSVATIVYYSMNLLWPTMVGALYTKDVLKIGWYSVALGGSVAVGQIMGGITIRPLKQLHWQMRISVVGIAAFTAGLAGAGIGQNALAIALTTLSGLSVGYVELLAIIMIPFVVDPGDIGLASGFTASCRTVSGTIATAIFSTVLSNENSKNIPSQVSSAAVSAGLSPSSVPAAIKAASLGTAKAYSAVPGMTTKIQAAIMHAVQVANSKSFKTMFLVSLAFSLASVISSLFIQSVDKSLTGEIARKLQGVRSGHGGTEKSEKTEEV